VGEIFSLRLPPEALKRLRSIARRSGAGPTQLARAWLLERLAEEAGSRRPQATAREPATGYSPKVREKRVRLPQDHLQEVALICRRRGVKRLGLFGSAARSDFDRVRSDLDFTVEFLDMPLGLRPASYFGLIEDLENLFGRHVDLADRNEISNPYLRTAIERDEITLYEAA
jgi:hypothetical protein